MSQYKHLLEKDLRAPLLIAVAVIGLAGFAWRTYTNQRKLLPGAQATFRELCHEKHSYRHCKKLLRKNNHDCYLYTKDVHGGGRFSGGKAIVSIDNKAYARCVLDPKAYLASLRKKTKKR